jgi:hypothetical protein
MADTPPLRLFHDGLVARLGADEELAAWATEHFGQPFTFLEGVAATEVKESEYPAIVIDNGVLREVDRGNTVTPKTFCKVEVSPSIVAAFLWRATTTRSLFDQRFELPDLVIKAVLRDRTLGGTVKGALVSTWDWLASKEPVAILGVRVTGTYELAVSA